MCGKGLLVDEDVRYEVTIEVKSAYDPMEITDEDLKKDHITEIKRLLQQMAGMDQQELEDEVYKVFKFDLCRTCQKKFLKNPLLKSARSVETF
jgi:hypothetical protein